MPMEWTQTDGHGEELRLWPHQSLPPQGFVLFIGITALLIAFPLLALIGTIVLWTLLPFMLVTLACIWWALKRSWRDNQIVEVLHFTSEHMTLTRDAPRRDIQHWDCQTYWAEAFLHPTGGPVPFYLTLRGNGREVELGAFLSEEERRALYGELRSRLAAVKRP